MTRPGAFLDIPYPGLGRTLLYIKEQAQNSLDFCYDWLPNYIQNPESLFTFLKSQVKYVNDPSGIEYIQSAQTLIEKSGGRGDCDCFTVLSLACLHVIGEKAIYTTIVGRNTTAPRHIYASYFKNGERTAFDLTNPVLGYERQNYKYIQNLKTKL
jgi:hypothetical protein